jgi:DnaK suppressor protein
MKYGRSMMNVRERLERDLRTTVSRFHTLDGRVAIEELAGAIGVTCPFADEVDQIQASASQEIGFATRELLLERVNRLSAALDRVNEGEYGTCVECEEPISLARLDALPEVQTCVRCQDRLERLGQLRPIISGSGLPQQRNRRAERAAEREWHRLQILARALIKEGLN